MPSEHLKHRRYSKRDFKWPAEQPGLGLTSGERCTNCNRRFDWMRGRVHSCRVAGRLNGGRRAKTCRYFLVWMLILARVRSKINVIMSWTLRDWVISYLAVVWALQRNDWWSLSRRSRPDGIHGSSDELRLIEEGKIHVECCLMVL